jgi:hypothetical protein
MMRATNASSSNDAVLLKTISDHWRFAKKEAMPSFEVSTTGLQVPSTRDCLFPHIAKN